MREFGRVRSFIQRLDNDLRVLNGPRSTLLLRLLFQIVQSLELLEPSRTHPVALLLAGFSPHGLSLTKIRVRGVFFESSELCEQLLSIQLLSRRYVTGEGLLYLGDGIILVELVDGHTLRL